VIEILNIVDITEQRTGHGTNGVLVAENWKMSKTIEDYLDKINKARLKGEDISQTHQSTRKILTESLVSDDAQGDERQEQISLIEDRE
jgi:hypothetical protein